MAGIDSTVVTIAIPTIGRAFHVGLGPLQWAVTGYTLTLSALLVLAGSLGDRFGRRRIFLIGVVFFAFSSAACALAQSPEMLIATRVLQGIGGALLTPGSLAILEASFVPTDRARAIGAWSGLGGVATAAGPILGGYLLAVASWRLIFLINLPIGAIVLLLTWRHVPESRDPDAHGRLDFLGAFLAVAALGGLTYALIEAPAKGWSSPTIVAPLVAAVAATAAFVVVERRSPTPMVPFGRVGNRQYVATNGETFLVYAALSGVLFLLPVELQVAHGYSPLASGVSLLPLTAIMLVFSARSGRLASRIGPRLQMTLGPCVIAAGYLLLMLVGGSGAYLSAVLPGMVVIGAGLAIVVAPLTATALGSVAEESAGIASAINNAVARAGGLIAVALLPALAHIAGDAYRHPEQFSHGFRTACVIGAAWCLGGGVTALVGIRNPPQVDVPARLEGTRPI